jgi:hypothetical protein
LLLLLLLLPLLLLLLLLSPPLRPAVCSVVHHSAVVKEISLGSPCTAADKNMGILYE